MMKLSFIRVVFIIAGVVCINSMPTPDLEKDGKQNSSQLDEKDGKQLDVTLEKATRFLTDYGYMSNSATIKQSNLRPTLAPSLSTLLSGTTSTIQKTVSQSLNPEIQEAIKSFQDKYHLPITGTIDEETSRLIGRPRCGIPDIESVTTHSENIVVPKKKNYYSKHKKYNSLLSGKRPDMNMKSMTDMKGKSNPTSQAFQSESGVIGTVLPGMSFEEDLLLESSQLESSIEEISLSSDDSFFENEFDEEVSEWTTLENTLELSTELVTEIATTIVNDVDVVYDITSTSSPLADDVVHNVIKKFSSKRDRRRRSTSLNGGVVSSNGAATLRFPNLPIKWRLLSQYCSQHFTNCYERNILELAFRRWAEVTPLTFQEHAYGDLLEVDIQIAFITPGQMGPSSDFSITLHEDELARYEVISSEVYLFFQDNMQWTHLTEHGYNLLSVAVHEIGHLLGLSHNWDSGSVMYPFYTTYEAKVAIETASRQAAQSIHGVCGTTIDTAFDWVRTLSNGRRVFSTFMFRGRYLWLYDNASQKPRYGDPREISSVFAGVPADIDAVVQFRPRKNSYDNMADDRDDLYFFKGNRYWRFDHNNRITYKTDPDTGVSYGTQGRLISEGWPALPGQTQRIPDNIDAVYFDQRDNNIYFFKGTRVYAYDTTNNGCCLPNYPKAISEAYPGRYSSYPSLPNNIHAAYYSIKNKGIFFFKGSEYWENLTYNPTHSSVTNRVGPIQSWSSMWLDICDVE